MFGVLYVTVYSASAMHQAFCSVLGEVVHSFMY